MKELHHYTGYNKILGTNNNLYNTDNIYGDCTHMRGNAQNLTGDVTGLHGDISGLSGDATDSCITFDIIAGILIGDVTQVGYNVLPIAEVL
jgi:hypothetical protein|tara:strand:- start:30 stop:302 length:273 start_codon:yes stop_codon:yes gene_type:complete